MRKPRHPLIVVLPVYEDLESASKLLHRLAEHCPTAPYIVAVEDGSVRHPLPASAIADAGLAGEVIHLARNMGHQRAIAAGLAYVAMHFEADVVVTMDGDGEDRPDSIPPLIERLQSGEVDAVVAERRKRPETLRFRAFYLFYRLIFLFMTGRSIRFGNFTALSMPAVRRLAAMQELWVHFAACLMVSKLRVAAVRTDRGRRYAGATRMNFVSLTLHGLRSMMVFAEDVLVRVGLFCIALAGVSVVLLVTSVVLKIIGLATPGWFSVVFGILLLILMQAGVLSFVTLMVSGVVRSAPPITRAQLDSIIDRVETTRGVDTIALPVSAGYGRE